MSLYKLLLAEAFSLPAYNVEQNLSYVLPVL